MRLSIFGATGSIGQNTLDLVRRNQEFYTIEVLSGGHNIAQLAKDAKEFGAACAVTAYPERFEELKEALSGSSIHVAAGQEALIEAAQRPADWVMSAIVGVAGLAPGFYALEHCGRLALANKESLVCAGQLLLNEASSQNSEIIPVDSEHSAIFQLLHGQNRKSIRKVQITASGGAFRDWPKDKLAEATPEEAATHPNWDMGQRITIDSASLFNKALEVIEAKELFQLDPGAIDVVIHPESILHALIQFHDGASIAHCGLPDMRHAIGYALHYPERKMLPLPALELDELASLTFRKWEPGRHKALVLAYDAMRSGGMAGAVLNAAKEAALDAFIGRQIGFLDMAGIVEAVLERASAESGFLNAPERLEDIAQWDQLSRVYAAEAIEKNASFT